MFNESNIFNHYLLKIKRGRIADSAVLERYSFLLNLVGEDLIERLESFEVKNVNFLEFNLPSKLITSLNSKYPKLKLTHADFSKKLLGFKPYDKVLVESETLPFVADSFDVILNNLNLHFANDLPGLLIQFNHLLSYNGVFLATIFGGETLREFKQALYEAEIELKGGIGTHFIPLCTLETAANLMQRAKFDSPVIDSYIITVTYPHVIDLMHDLRYMAQTSMLFKNSHLTRKLIELTNKIYFEKFKDSENQLIASFEIITLNAKKRKS